ncbi:MAG: hypothetical protein ACO3UU_10145 [Minisyncoccia bacterium]
MSQYTLTKYEKRLVDNYIIKVVDSGSTKKFSPALFNNVLCNILPAFRAEELTNGQNTRNIAYIDYVKDFYKIKYKS